MTLKVTFAVIAVDDPSDHDRSTPAVRSVSCEWLVSARPRHPVGCPRTTASPPHLRHSVAHREIPLYRGYAGPFQPTEAEVIYMAMAPLLTTPVRR